VSTAKAKKIQVIAAAITSTTIIDPPTTGHASLSEAATPIF
jgi:hypothetical protein